MKKQPIKYLKYFGLKLWLIEASILVLNKLNIFNRIKEKLIIIKKNIINKYLTKKYNNVISKYKNASIKNEKYSNKIFIFWWQNLEKADEIIKIAINSIKKQCTNKEIIIITKENIDLYYKMPKFIKEKFDNGEITLTHFSDILRMNLLRKYGGFWMDATIFLTSKPKLNQEFTTIKFHTNEKTSISNGKWCGFYIGGKNQLFYEFMVDFFNEYWKNESIMIDYFLIDYIINIAYNNIELIKEKFDNVPFNNEEIHKLCNILNNEYNDTEWKKLTKNNYVHKLSYKKNIIKNNKDNYYNKIKNLNEM